MKISKDTIYNKAVWLLTICLMSTFYIFESKAWAAYLAIGIAILIFTVCALKKRDQLVVKIEPFHIFVLAFALFCLLSAIWALKAGYAIEKAGTVIKILVCMSLVYAYYQDKKDVSDILSAVMWAGYTVVLYAFLHYGFKTVIDGLKGVKLENSFANVNSIAMIAGTALIINFSNILRKKLTPAVVLIIPAIIIIAATGSRKGLVFLVGGIVLLAFFKILFTSIEKKSYRKFWIGMGCIALALALLIVLIFTLPMFELLATRMKYFFASITGKGEVDSSTVLRNGYLEIGFKQFIKTPILGIGIGNPRILVNEVFARDTYLHNNFLELLTGGGVIGFIVYYSMYAYIIYCMVRYWKNGDEHFSICATLIILFLVMDWAQVTYYSKSTYLYFLIFFLYIKKLSEKEGKAVAVGQIAKKGGQYLFDPDYRFLINASLGKYNQMPDELYLRKKYKAIMGKDLNLENPQTFNEKLQWMKLYDRDPEYVTLVDKYKVREHIAQTLGEEYLIPLIGAWDTADDIDFDALPEKFVLKCNHNSGLGMCICKDKSKLDVKKVKEELKKGLKQDYYLSGREWPYKDVPRKIICEKFMSDKSGGLIDYKFFCFNGVADCVMVCLDRHLNDTKFYFFDKEWKLKRLNIRGKNAPEGFTVEKPSCMDEMFAIAEKLSEGLAFARVDLYECDGKIYFGEITFFPDSGFDPNILPETDVYFGEKFNLKENN